MIDLHCHMLPGIDDGPKTMDKALDMARYAVEQGIQRSVMTPHIQPGSYDNDSHSIQSAYQGFKEALKQAAIPLQIEMAAEVRVCAELPILINQGKVPFLGQWQGMQLILLEFPHDHVPLGADKLINWLLDRNILPLIAHPERNQAIMRRPDKILPFLEMGCLIQLTAGSITGLFGEDSRKCALLYIEQDRVTAIATDAHNLHKRQPNLQTARQFLLPSYGEDSVNNLMAINPARILA
jgi:protein-tyrosine phosphatase